MNDIISRQLLRAISRKKTSCEILQRFFRVYYRINLSHKVIENRLAQLS